MAIIPLDLPEQNKSVKANSKANIVPLDNVDSQFQSQISSIKTSDQSPEERDPKWAERVRDRVYANAKAGYAGALAFGSSLTKIAEKLEKGLLDVTGRSKYGGEGFGGKTGFFTGRGKEAQQAYESAEAEYQRSRDKYPETIGSKFAGEILSAGPIGSARILSAGARLGERLGGAGGATLGATVSGATTGSVLGGIHNQPGMGADEIWNPQSAGVGGVVGAALGPVGGVLLPKWAEATAKYQQGKEALASSGYKGPILARDFTSEGVIRDTKNKLMDNIPFMTTAIRDEQIGSIRDAVGGIVQAIGKKAEYKTEQEIGGIINNTRNTMLKESDRMWTDVFKSAKMEGIKHIPISGTSKEAALDVSQFEKDMSAYDYRRFIKPILESKAMSPEYMHELKRNLWPLYTKAAKRDTPIQDDVAESIKHLYWKLDDNLGTALENTGANTSYRAAKEFTKRMLNTFDPKMDKKLALAVHEVNEKSENLRGFINSIMRPKSSETSPYYSKAFGSSYDSATQRLALTRAYNRSMNYETGNLNLNTFFKDVEAAGANNIVTGQTLDALKGLHSYTEAVSGAQETAQKSAMHYIKSAAPIALAAAAGADMAGGAGLGTGTIASIIATSATLGWLSKTSPLKNVLITLSKTYGKNPEITESIIKKLGTSLPKSGVIITNDGENQVIDKPKPSGKGMLKISMAGSGMPTLENLGTQIRRTLPNELRDGQGNAVYEV